MNFHNFHYKGISIKITLVVIIIFSASTLSVNYFIYNEVRQSLSNADNQEILNEAQQLLNKMGSDPEKIPLPDEGLFIRIILRSPTSVREIFSSTDFPEQQIDTEIFEIIEIPGYKIATVYEAIDDFEAGILELSVARDNSLLNTQLSTIKQYLFIANLVAIILSGILSLVITSLFLRPIKKIILTAEGIQASKNMDRLDVPNTQDEIQKIAETINRMLQRIEDDINHQTNFFNSASHELRTPLTVMQTELNLALQKNNNHEQKQLIESQLLEVDRLARIIKDFLLIGQLKGNVLHINKTESSIDEIIYSALKKIQKLTISENKHVKFNINENLRELNVYCDVDKTENVLINLFENGVKYSSSKTALCIDLEKKGYNHHLIITNQIDEAVPNLESLTTEYHRTDYRISGMGLGLWICKNIIQLHNGSIALSQSEDQFRIDLILPIGSNGK